MATGLEKSTNSRLYFLYHHLARPSSSGWSPAGSIWLAINALAGPSIMITTCDSEWKHHPRFRYLDETSDCPLDARYLTRIFTAPAEFPFRGAVGWV